MNNFVRNFYNDYAPRQIAIGVNKRHLCIANWLQKHNLGSMNSVLEIGCGVGTLSQLIIKNSPLAQFTGIDISDESIEHARTKIKTARTSFIAGDILSLELSQEFDMVILADVMEHLPQDKYVFIFKKLKKLLKVGGNIFLNYPDYNYHKWVLANSPSEAQIIDNPLCPEILFKSVLESELLIEEFQSYKIWSNFPDYTRVRISRKIDRNYDSVTNNVNKSIKINAISKYARALFGRVVSK